MRRHLIVVMWLALLAASCARREPGTSASSPPLHAQDAQGVADAAPPWAPDRRCQRDDECVPAPGCCPAPCTSHVINVKDLARVRAELDRTCPKDQPCPSAGSCRTHAYLCVEGQCALVYEGDPGWRPRP